MALTPIGMLYLASLVNLISWSHPNSDAAELTMDRVRLTTIIPAERGAILDRHGLVLAEDRCSWNLVINYLPQDRSLIRGLESEDGGGLTVEQVLERVQILADGTQIPFAELWRALMVDPRGRQVLRRGLTLSEREMAIQALKRVPYSGLSLEQEFDRVYPNGAVLAHVIGLVGDKGSPQIQTDDKANSGFEGGLNDLLEGMEGKRHTLSVSGDYGVDLALDNLEAQAGQSIRTSLDLNLSEYARTQLVELMEDHQPWRCMAITLDVKTGQVLSMMGLPDYDANDPMQSIERRENPYTGEVEEVGWVNPSRWNFEPGSTMKPLIAAYALQRGAITKEQRFQRFGGRLNLPHRLPRNVITDTGTMPPGDYRAFEGIVESSNIVYAQIAREIGREGMADLLDFYQYHDKIFELVGLEQKFMPRFSPPREAFMKERGPDGMAYTIPNMGFGQGFEIPPLDHALAIASIANGGNLLEATFDPASEATVRAQLFDASTTAYVREAMLGMVNKETRNWLPHRDDLRYCGKSGTAKIRSGPFLNKYTSSFVCYGPYEDPEVLVLVVAYGTSYADRIGTHHFGSKVAGPAAANILYRALELRGSLPTSGNQGLDWNASAATLDR